MDIICVCLSYQAFKGALSNPPTPFPRIFAGARSDSFEGHGHPRRGAHSTLVNDYTTGSHPLLKS